MNSKKVFTMLLTLGLLMITTVAMAEMKIYTGVGKCTMGDLVTNEQAMRYAKARAEQNAKEQAGVYIKTYTRANNTKLTDNVITTMANNITQINGDVQYTKKPGEVDGEPVIVYTATLQATVDDSGIGKWLKLDRKEKDDLVSQNVTQKAIEGDIKHIEDLSQQYNKATTQQEKDKIKGEFQSAENDFLSNQKVKEGNDLYYKKNYPAAIACYNEALAINSRNVDAWERLGDVYYQQKENDKAIECYQKAIEINPDCGRAWRSLGGLYTYNLHDEKKAAEYYEKAAECYRKNTAQDSDNASLWRDLAWVYGDSLKQYDKAVECFKKALEIEPNDEFMWSQLGSVYRTVGDKENASICYQQVVDLRSGKSMDANEWQKLGQAYRDVENYDKALECYRKAVSVDPKSARLWRFLGSFYRSTLKDYDKAIEAYNKANILDPNDEYCWWELGDAYYEKKDYKKGVECFQKAVEIEPKSSYYWSMLGNCYAKQKDFDNAIRCYRQILEFDQRYKSAWDDLGESYFQQGKYSQAVYAFDKYLEIEPGNDRITKKRATAEWKLSPKHGIDAEWLKKLRDAA